MLDIGVSWQQPDGSFLPGYYHSNVMFLEGLARSIWIDSKLQNREYYLNCLKNGMSGFPNLRIA
jgi:hypothetical protein